MKKNIVFIVLFFGVIIQALPLYGEQLPAEDGAVAVIETLNRVLIESMKQGEELGFQGRFTLLEPVMKQTFFFSYMVRKSTGSYWKELDSGQQEKLVETYITWSVGKYAQRFKEYKNQQFLVVSSDPVKKKYRRVVVHIINQEGKKRELNYILAKSEDSWLIVDIQVKGVSQLSLTRAQFRSVLKDKGYDGLLELLNEKIITLEQDDMG